MGLRIGVVERNRPNVPVPRPSSSSGEVACLKINGSTLTAARRP